MSKGTKRALCPRSRTIRCRRATQSKTVGKFLKLISRDRPGSVDRGSGQDMGRHGFVSGSAVGQLGNRGRRAVHGPGPLICGTPAHTAWTAGES